ncbi:MAG: NTP transferase domain-containing protein [Chitinophagales bacterium]
MKKAGNGVSAIVLAAGESKRMGERNKLLLPFRNEAVIHFVIRNIVSSGADEVIVVLGHEAEKVKSALADLPIKFVLNEKYERGMTTSIQQGVRHASGSGFMICLSDMVMIIAEEYALMKNDFLRQLKKDEKCICIPRYENEKGNPVIFSSAYRNAILQHKEMEGCKSIVLENKEHIHWVEMQTSHVLQDFDFPGDYERLQN